MYDEETVKLLRSIRHRLGWLVFALVVMPAILGGCAVLGLL